MQRVKNIGQGFIHLFYPRLCEGCTKPLHSSEEVLCLSCSLQMPKTEYHAVADNETAMRFAGRIPFQNATSYAYFTNDGLLQHLLHGLKYKNKKEIGIYLGKQLAYDLLSTAWLKDIDSILPVPLHPKKEAIRGYNQSAVIAEGMSSILRKPFVNNAISRVRYTDTQTKKTREERVNNMKDAFQVNNSGALSNKHLLLVDDVLTTGATIEACALTLMSLPGVKLSIATIGIVV